VKKYSMLLTAIIIIFAVSLCNAAPDQQSNPTAPELSAVQKKLVTASNEFAFKIFKQICKAEADTNIFISPFSIYYALGMAYNGADGDTKDSIANVLQYGDLTDQEINESYKSLADILTTIDPNVMMEIANSIWLGSTRETFRETCKQYFDAIVGPLGPDASGTANSINRWISENTHNRINNVVSPQIIMANKGCLVNTVYFKGEWTREFDKKKTMPRLFYTDDTVPINCNMMQQENNLRHNFNEDFQAVDLPYSNAGFRMAIFLPRSGKTPDDIITKLNSETWKEWLASYENDKITLTLPKFKVTYARDLINELRALGMGIAFSPGKADFGRISTGWALTIVMVLHNTFIQVDEEGTEAAGVTVIVFDEITPMGKETTMTVNRPFLFVIHDSYTGAILFMGKIVNPVWEE
jgi:serine protease inhibitor